MTDTSQQDETELPADARLWIERQERGESAPWDETDVEFLAPGHLPRILDNSYLTADDLANPEIAANVRANEDTAALITWIAQTDDRAYGYWRGPNAIPIEEAPVVEHDTEGQFYLVGASSITETLVDAVTQYGGSWDEVVEVCRAAGVTKEIRTTDAWGQPEVSPTPREFHATRDEHHRGNAGA